MTTKSILQHSIKSGLEFLKNCQGTNGEFKSSWSKNRDMMPSVEVSSPFITGLILDILRGVPNVRKVQTQGLDFLASSSRENGWYSFFDEGIDVDLDDTCLINLNLQLYGIGQTDHLRLSRTIAALSLPGGRFQTWIRRNALEPNDIDVCVCANVLRYLTHNGITTDLQWLILATQNWDPGKDTLYYVQPYALLYFVCQMQDSILRFVVDQNRTLTARIEIGGHQDHLDAAFRLIVGVKIRANNRLVKALAMNLVQLQRDDGGWASVAAFQAFNYWGSDSLVTAGCVRALYDTMLRLESCEPNCEP